MLQLTHPTSSAGGAWEPGPLPLLHRLRREPLWGAEVPLTYGSQPRGWGLQAPERAWLGEATPQVLRPLPLACAPWPSPPGHKWMSGAAYQVGTGRSSRLPWSAPPHTGRSVTLTTY